MGGDWGVSWIGGVVIVTPKKELSNALKDALERLGGWRIWKMDDFRRSAPGTKSLPDEGWIVRGQLIAVEIKSDSDSLRKGQEVFWSRFLSRKGENMHYVLLESVEQVDEIMNIVNKW